MSDGRLVQMHAAFEARNHDVAEYEQLSEQHRQALYARQHGSLDGYRPRREFPCPGALRVYAETDTYLLIACDTCDYENACRIEHKPSGAAAW